jgi:hypothetical protein
MLLCPKPHSNHSEMKDSEVGSYKYFISNAMIWWKEG